MTATASVPTTGGAPGADTSRAAAGAVLVLALVGFFVTILDTSIVITGLPSIQSELGFTTAGLTWVQSVYLITFGGLLMLGARLGDLVGRRAVLVAGLVVFGLASLLIGSAPDGGLLIAARALQGVGAAMLTPSTLALITENFAEGPLRRRAVAWYSAIAGVGAALGLVLGGVAAELLSWRVGFLINLPITAVLTVVALRALPGRMPRAAGAAAADADAADAGDRTERHPRFDIAGALLSIVGAGGLAFAFVEAGERGWTSPPTLVGGALGVLGIVSLLLVERRVAHPLIPLHLVRDRTRGGAYLIRGLFIAGFQTFFFFTSQYLQLSAGFGPLEAGLGFLPMTIVNFAVALAVGPVVARLGARTTLAAGLVVAAIGMLWLSAARPDAADPVGSYVLAVALPMALIGAGQGLALAPLTSFGVAGTRPDEAGAASGLLNVSHQLIGAMGLSLLTALSAGAALQSSAALAGAAIFLAVTVVIALAVIPRSAASERTSA